MDADATKVVGEKVLLSFICLTSLWRWIETSKLGLRACTLVDAIEGCGLSCHRELYSWRAEVEKVLYVKLMKG